MKPLAAKPLAAKPEMVWTSNAMFQLTASREDARLACVVQPMAASDGSTVWQVIALQTPTGAQSLEQVFDAHSHKIVGAYETIPAAFEAAESFAKAWVKEFKSASFKTECACNEISDEGREYIKKLNSVKTNTFDSAFKPRKTRRSA